MINLNIQIKLIFFSFSFGFFFSAFFELYNYIISNKKELFKIISSIFFVGISSVIYFVGIQKISNAIFHIYSIISVVLGYIVYDIIIKIIANNNKK